MRSTPEGAYHVASTRSAPFGSSHNQAPLTRGIGTALVRPRNEPDPGRKMGHELIDELEANPTG